MSPEEAELAKLFTNAWRYIRFAAANQLYQVANDHGLDFEAIRQGLIADYPRADDMPSAGLTAGPCLLKDTRQLAAAHRGGFPLGDAAIAVNEGMPRYLVHRLAQRYDLAELTVGVLGMAFKAGSDDIRSSLSYELSRLLAARARAVLCTDPYVTCDPGLVPLGDVLAAADLLVIAAPHPQYRDLRAAVPVADIWNLLGAGART
jgi:UDP-N-acetyl-D-mannosaminuronic acid dehydrogenase